MIPPSTYGQMFGDLGLPLLNKGWGVFPVDQGKATSIRWKQYQRHQPSHVEIRNWQNRLPTAGIALPFGPVNDHVLGLDIDADDPTEAATANEIADDVFGPSPVVRVGRWPRTLRLYRGRRIRSRRMGDVELLARGKYAVMYGQHPVTGEPYRHVGPAQLLDLRATDVPWITRKQVDTFERELGSIVPYSQLTTTHRSAGATGLTLRQATEGVREGQRHHAMFCIASAYRGLGRRKADAIRAVQDAAGRCSPPYSSRAAEKVVDWVYGRLAPGVSGNELPHFVAPDVPRVLRVAYENAITNPYPIKPGSERYRLLLGICVDLQQFRQDQPIVLPQLALARLLGCSQQAVSKLIGVAIRDALLRVTDSGYKKGHRAKLYRFSEPNQPGGGGKVAKCYFRTRHGHCAGRGARGTLSHLVVLTITGMDHG